MPASSGVATQRGCMRRQATTGRVRKLRPADRARNTQALDEQRPDHRAEAVPRHLVPRETHAPEGGQRRGIRHRVGDWSPAVPGQPPSWPCASGSGRCRLQPVAAPHASPIPAAQQRHRGQREHGDTGRKPAWTIGLRVPGRLECVPVDACRRGQPEAVEARLLSYRQRTMRCMSFQPHTADRPCWHCVHYEGFDRSGALALCANAGCSRCRTQPERGCSAFVREIGADDEPSKVPSRQNAQPMPGRRGAS